jgi:23S rRNA pseudouridine1911/1915/1917 synthase
MSAKEVEQSLHQFPWKEKWRGQRLKPVVQSLLPALGSRNSFLVITNGLVRDGEGKDLENPDLVLEQPLTLVVDLRHGIRGRGKPKRKSLRDRVEVLHDDNDIVVVVKSANVLTAPVDRGIEPKKKTLGPPVVETLQHYWKQRGVAVINPILIQRLDVETSGLIVLAKNPRAAAILQKQLQPPRTLKRTYLAIVAGTFTEKSGSWKSYLGRGKNSLRQTVGDVVAKGSPPAGSQEATTTYEVVEELPGATLLRLELGTGRTHQIRIHCAESGHPVLGDEHYRILTQMNFERFVKKNWHVLTKENPAWEARALFDAGQQETVLPKKSPRRMALHATKLSFRHPTNNKVMTFEAPLPQDLLSYLDLIRKVDNEEGGKKPRTMDKESGGWQKGLHSQAGLAPTNQGRQPMMLHGQPAFHPMEHRQEQ